jgi:endonuclease/exonuclease/phosphatase (EEP) superfamily protein YafD
LYPHIFFDPRSRYGPAILAKRAWIEAGIVKTKGESPLAVWALFVHEDQAFVVASVHIANPFEPKGQVDDIDRLIEYARAQDGPIIMGGDFNLTPFSWKLAKLAHETGLRWAQTLEASWPADRLAPFVLLDHVGASPTSRSSRQGSARASARIISRSSLI